MVVRPDQAGRDCVLGRGRSPNRRIKQRFKPIGSHHPQRGSSGKPARGLSIGNVDTDDLRRSSPDRWKEGRQGKEHRPEKPTGRSALAPHDCNTLVHHGSFLAPNSNAGWTWPLIATERPAD